MKKRTFYLISNLVFVCLCTDLGIGQKLSVRDEAKLDAADRAAASFVERFRKTRDFEGVWRAYRAKDTKCAIRFTPALDIYSKSELEEKSFDQRLREKGLDDVILERLFVTTWNSSLLLQGYHYSYARSINGSEPAEAPSLTSASKHGVFREMLKTLYKEDDSDSTPNHKPPPTRREVKKMIDGAEKTGQLFKRYVPKDFLKTKNWRSAVKWFADVHDVGGKVIDRERFADRCSAGKGPLYVSQIGFFVFIFSEENGQMRLWSMSFIDN